MPRSSIRNRRRRGSPPGVRRLGAQGSVEGRRREKHFPSGQLIGRQAPSSLDTRPTRAAKSLQVTACYAPHCKRKGMHGGEAFEKSRGIRSPGRIFPDLGPPSPRRPPPRGQCFLTGWGGPWRERAEQSRNAPAAGLVLTGAQAEASPLCAVQ